MTEKKTENLLEAISLEPVKAPATKRYHFGIYEDGMPNWYIPVAGVTFSVTTSTFDKADREIPRQGDIADLTIDQIKAIKAKLPKLIVRWRRDPKTKAPLAAELLDKDTQGFTVEPGDVPLARYLYLRPAPAEMVAPRPSESFLAQIDAALREAEHAEDEAQSDPEDAETRAEHGKAKRAGTKIPAEL